MITPPLSWSRLIPELLTLQHLTSITFLRLFLAPSGQFVMCLENRHRFSESDFLAAEHEADPGACMVIVFHPDQNRLISLLQDWSSTEKTMDIENSWRHINHSDMFDNPFATGTLQLMLSYNHFYSIKHKLFSSGRCYRALHAKTTRHRKSLFAGAIPLMNSEPWMSVAVHIW